MSTPTTSPRVISLAGLSSHERSYLLDDTIRRVILGWHTTEVSFRKGSPGRIIWVDAQGEQQHECCIADNAACLIPLLNETFYEIRYRHGDCVFRGHRVDGVVEAYGPSFEVAASIALLRAHGVEVRVT